jgi:hypothetical protein
MWQSSYPRHTTRMSQNSFQARLRHGGWNVRARGCHTPSSVLHVVATAMKKVSAFDKDTCHVGGRPREHTVHTGADEPILQRSKLNLKLVATDGGVCLCMCVGGGYAGLKAQENCVMYLLPSFQGHARHKWRYLAFFPLSFLVILPWPVHQAGCSHPLTWNSKEGLLSTKYSRARNVFFVWKFL